MPEFQAPDLDNEPLDWRDQRDALKADQATATAHFREQLSGLRADNARLRAEQKRIGNEFQDCLLGKLEEIDRLRADAERWGEQSNDLSATLHRTETQLTELREAAEALEKRARREAEFLRSEGYKRGMYLEQDCDEFKAVAWRVTPPPAELTVTEPLNVTAEQLAQGGEFVSLPARCDAPGPDGSKCWLARNHTYAHHLGSGCMWDAGTFEPSPKSIEGRRQVFEGLDLSGPTGTEIALPTDPEERARLTKLLLEGDSSGFDEAGPEGSTPPIAEGHGWVNGSLKLLEGKR